MRTNQPLGTVLKKTALSVLLLALILANSFDTYGQASLVPVNQYTPLVNTGGRALTAQNSAGVVLVHGWTSPAANAIDADLTTKATWTSLVSLGGLTQAWMEVTDPNATGAQAYPVGSYAGFVIDNFGVLDLSNTVTITTYLGGVEKESYTADGSVLAVSLLGGGRAKVGFITKLSAFDRVRITFNVVGVATSRSVYYAELLRPQAGAVPPCNTTTALVQDAYPATVVTGTTGIANVSLLGSIFSNPGNVVDANTSNATTITLPVGALSTAYVSVKEAGAPGAISHPAGYFAGFEVSNSTLLGLGLLANSTLTTYLDGVQKESKSGNDLLLSAPLLSGGSRSTIGFVTTQEFDEVRYTLTQPLSVNLGTTSVYAAVIKQFCAGALVCNTPTRMNSTQQPVYIDGSNSGFTGAVCAACNLTGVDNVIDGNAGTAATMNLTVGVGTTGSLAVADAVTTYAAGTFAGFDIQSNTILDIQVPNAVRIDLLNNGTVVQSTTGPALLAGVSTGLLSDPSRQMVGVIATVPFDEVKISFNSLLNADLGLIRIYDAIWQKNCETPLPCNQTVLLKAPDYGVVINGQRTGFDGAVNAAGVVQNPWNLVNSNTTDYARIQTVANVLAQGSISVASGADVFPGGVYAGFLVRENSANPLALVNLLKIITINTYKRDASGVSQLVESKTGSQLLGLTVLAQLLGNDYGVKNIGFVTTQPFDEMQISVGGLANVGATAATLDVFSATIDTRYAVPGTSGLSCPLFRTNPDINYTTVNKLVDGSVATNDQVPAGTIYSNPVPVNGADGLPNPAGATLTLNPDGSGKYTFVTPTPGTYSYNITVTNGTISEVQNLTITVTDGGVTTNPPIANTDIAETVSPNAVTVDVLANDHAGNPGGALTGPLVDKDGSNGQAVVNSGKIVYTPDAGFIGKDTVVYTITEAGKTAKAYIIIDVKPAGVANSTSASDDFAMTTAAMMVSGNVKTNDVDPEGNTQTITTQDVTNASGHFVLRADGTYDFTPAAGVSGTAQFAYTTCDNGTPQACAMATLYVAVEAKTDLVPRVSLTPVNIIGSSTVEVTVQVSEIAKVASSGLITLFVEKLSLFSDLSFDPAATVNAAGDQIQNSQFTIDATSNPNYYVITTSEVLNDSNRKLMFKVTVDPASTKGTSSVNVSILANSGGDTNADNNSHFANITYSYTPAP